MDMVLENFATRLKNLREAKGLTKYRLAKLSGIPEAYIGQLESGKVDQPRRNTLEMLAKGLGVELPIFFGGEEKRSPQSALSDLEVSIGAYIPVYGEVSAGSDIEPIDYVACTRSKTAPDSYRAFRVKGLCMEPEIQEGDTLIVDTELQPRKGDLVIVLNNEKASVKRYSTIKGTFHYLENNKGKYRIAESNIVGVVIEFNRKKR